MQLKLHHSLSHKDFAVMQRLRTVNGLARDIDFINISKMKHVSKGTQGTSGCHVSSYCLRPEPAPKIFALTRPSGKERAGLGCLMHMSSTQRICAFCTIPALISDACEAPVLLFISDNLSVALGWKLISRLKS